MAPRRRRFLFGSIVLLASLAVVEIELRVLAATSASVDGLLMSPATLAIVPDDDLGWRPNRRHPEHDRYGFRNRNVPEQIDLLALGDSQVYGVGVMPDRAWPQRVGSLQGCSTYNMGFGGYGPAHCLLLFDEAIAREPVMIIQAIYSGNDFLDSYRFVYENGQLPRFVNSDSTVLSRLGRAESDEPMEELIGRHSGAGPPTQASFQSRLADRFRVLGLIRAVRNALRGIAGRDRQEANPLQSRQSHSIDHGKIRTVFTPALRQIALNPEDARILEGQRISIEVLKEMRMRSEAIGSQFRVVLIPTKEFVFRNYVKGNRTNLSEVHWQLVENEDQLWMRMKRSLDQNGLEYVDADPALRGALENGDQPYPESNSGHPNAVGHEAIARAVMVFCP